MPFGYFPYTHLEPEIKTIKQLFERPDLRDSYFVNLSPVQLLDQTFLLGYSETLSLKNRDLIYRLYTKEEKSKIKSADEIDENSPIKLNTIIYCKQENIRRDLLFSQTLNVQKTYSSNAFVSQKLKELMSNPDYVRTYTSKNGNVPNKIRVQNAEIQVFIWVRGLKNNEPISNIDLWRLDQLDNRLTNLDKNSPEFTGLVTEETRNSTLEFVDNDLEGSWLDITPFIESINTTVSDTGGNFSFSLSPVVCTYDKLEGWILDPFSIKNYISNDINDSFAANTLLHKIENGELKKNQFFFHNILSENDLVYIKFEPLRLEEKDRNRIKQQTRLTGTDIPSQTNLETKEVVQERVYDMIGLVDICGINFNHGSNDITINIQGRDLVKTIIEDGTYFFPSEFAQGMFLTAGEGDLKNSRLIKRVMFSGQIQNLGIYYEKTIQTVMQFIISQLANTGYVPNSVFYGYKERRNTSLTLDKNFERRQIVERQQRIEDHYNKIVEYISKTRKFYRDTNVLLGRERNAGIKDASNNDLRQMLLDFGQFLIDNDMNRDEAGSEEFSDFYLNGWTPWIEGSEFSTIFGLSEQASGIQLQFKSIYPEAFSGYIYPEEGFVFREELGKRNDGVIVIHPYVGTALSHAYAYLKLKGGEVRDQVKQTHLQGVWQIIDLVIDHSVRDRILVDTSISQEQGSLINTINKVCQKPLVEFYTDTYGDRFVFIIRKPPTDEKSILGMIYGNSLSTETSTEVDKGIKIEEKSEKEKVNQIVNSLTREELFGNQDIQQQDIFALTSEVPTDESSGIIIDIEEGDIMSENLTWYNNEIYTWYRIIPKGYLWGTSEEMTWAFLPAIYFEEYCDIWGNRPFIVTINYLPLKADSEADKAFKQDPIIVQTYYDLKYIIESHAYLPFTRQGSINLVSGDRRIKKGIWIRLKGTGEVYYVDSVTQSYTTQGVVDRVTSIQVSRGMKEKFLKPQNIPGITSPVSYFNIINTELKLSETQKVNEEAVQNETLSIDLKPETVLSNFRVNKEVFNFFLQRRQLNDI